ncbi:MAG: DUF905 family protein, partial [Hafnia sp.]
MIVRDAEVQMVWRAWNFEPDAGEGLNRYISKPDIFTDVFTHYQQHLTFPNTHYYSIRQPSPLAFFIDGDIPMTTAAQNNLASANESEFELTVTQVPNEQRLDFWPQHFGTIPQWITLEPRIFTWMDRFCDEYNGGIWSFYT